jgi:hypothetical protein
VCRTAAPLIVVVEEIQHRSQPRGNALIDGEWPSAIDDMQDQVRVCAGLQAITTLELR